MSSTGYIMNKLGEKNPLNLKQSSIVVLSFVLLSLFGNCHMYINPFWEGIDSFYLFASSFLESTSGFPTTEISRPENLPDSNGAIWNNRFTLYIYLKVTKIDIVNTIWKSESFKTLN